MSTSYSWEVKRRYGSFRLRMNVQVKLWNPLRTLAIPERFCVGDSLRRCAISSVCTFTITLPVITLKVEFRRIGYHQLSNYVSGRVGDAGDTNHSDRVAEAEASGHAAHAGLRDVAATWRHGSRSRVRGGPAHHRAHQPLDPAGRLPHSQHRLASVASWLSVCLPASTCFRRHIYRCGGPGSYFSMPHSALYRCPFIVFFSSFKTLLWISTRFVAFWIVLVIRPAQRSWVDRPE